jgi:hypothetical protein
MRYSVRLVYRGELVQSVFNDITIDGALVQQLGEIENYTTTRAAQEYQVSERHLAIFADTSGALTIPPVSVSGRLQQQNTDGSGRSRYFELHSEPRRVPVRARPLAYSGSDWLPAHELTLQAIWPQQPPQLYAGEPVELQLLIEARGLSPFQLPQLSLPSIEHASVYPGPSEDTSTSDQHHVTLRRQQQITIVAGRPGMLLVPEFKLDWWDTKQNLQRMAFVSAQLIPVLPAATALLRPGAADSAAERLPAAPPDATVFTVPWRWSASLLLLLWLMTLYGWWRERRTR